MPEIALQQPFDAILFDMDGTILTSIKAAERVWAAWFIAHGLDPVSLLPTIHGMKSVETVRRLNLPGVNPEAEATAITAAEIADVEGIEAIAGAKTFLTSLPADRWAVVTSAPRLLALRRIEAAGLPLPPVMITGEDVENGKPAPDCFMLAAKRLGTTSGRCLVFEDAAAGIAAAQAAGCKVIVVTTTHTHPMKTEHDKIADFSRLHLSTDEAGALRLAWTD